MKNEHKHFLARLFVGAFLILGMGFRMTKFVVVDAANWDLPGGSGWDNITTYLDQTFRANDPTSGDIITALYGSGDEGSIYTQNRSGYDSSSCLASGMNVEFTDVIPSVISGNTIYVIASGTYEVSSPIVLEDCSALITSGIVTISGNLAPNGAIASANKHNIILEKIRITHSNFGYGILMNDLKNFFFNEIKVYDNMVGMQFSTAANGGIRNMEIYDNADGSIILNGLTDASIDTINVHDNGADGLRFFGASGVVLSGIEIYNNMGDGISMNVVNGMTLTNGLIYSNESKGINMYYADNTILNAIDTHDNGDHNIFLDTSNDNTLTDVIANTSAFSMGVYLGNSSGNVFSGVTADGNYYEGIFLYNSSHITGENITSNSNNEGIRLEISSYNNLSNLTVNNSENNGIQSEKSSHNNLSNLTVNNSKLNGILFSGSDYTTLDGVSSSGNYYAGMALYNSSYNTGSNITSNGDEGGLYVGHSTGNNFDTITINNSTNNGVAFFGANNNSLSGLVSSGNMGYGVYYTNSNYNTIRNSIVLYNASVGIFIETGISNIILNSMINNNGVASVDVGSNGILLSYCSGTIINGSTLASNTIHGITLDSSDNNQIIDSSINENYYRGISLLNSKGNIISGDLLSGNGLEGLQLMQNSNNNIISNVINLNPYIYGFGTRMYDSTGNRFYQFSGNQDILELYNDEGMFQYTVYDSFTQTNNNIILSAVYLANLTGNVSVGGVFSSYFNRLGIGTGAGNEMFNLYGINSFTVSGANRDGKIYFPNKITTGAELGIIGESGTTNIRNILDTIKVVSGITYLIMNGGSGDIRYNIGSGEAGQYLKILKSTNGNSWTLNTPDSGCILEDGQPGSVCHFTTDGDIKLFAFGVPGVFFTATTASGTHVISGAYYNTGISITFTGDGLTGVMLNGSGYTNGTAITGEGIHRFVMSNIWGDTTGISFTIDTTNPIITGNYPTSGLTISGGNNITFTRSGSDTNISGYIVYIHRIDDPMNDPSLAFTTNSYYNESLPNGIYFRNVQMIDRAGNVSTSDTVSFTISTPLTGTITVTGTNMLSIGGQRYTTGGVGLYLRPNQPCNYTVTGDIRTFINTGTTGALYVYPYLTGSDGMKNVYVTLSSTSGDLVTGVFTPYLDTSTTAPALVLPTSGGVAEGAFTLNRSTVTDSGIGLSGYQYFVATTTTLATGTIITSGFTTSTSVSIANMQLGSSGTFYWQVKAIDKLGNTASSPIQSFSYTGIADTVPDSFSLNNLTNRTIDTIYGSNTITVSGLSPNTQTLASINRGVLYISGHMVGTTGFVQNGWTVKIELISSSDYDTTVTSTLDIGGITAVFRITTETEAEANNDENDISTNLSSTEKLQIIAVFEALRDVYAGSKQDEFLNSFRLMLQSKIDDLGTSSADIHKRDALQYLYDLVDQYRDDGGSDGSDTDIASTSWIKNGVYTAPNGKKYTITYDSARHQFTSSNFVTPKYFPTLAVMKNLIDINNPVGSSYTSAKPIKARWGRIAIDGTWQTSPYTAPNYKVFYFFKTMDGQYSSYTFTIEKFFYSLDDVKEYIHNANLK